MKQPEACNVKPPRKVVMLLTVAGAIPFVVLAIALYVMTGSVAPIEAQSQVFQVKLLLGSYGVVIATFVAGSHWGNIIAQMSTHANASQVVGVSRYSPWPLSILILSNIFTLTLWGVWVLGTFQQLLLGLTVLFPLLLSVDYALYREHTVWRQYFYLRVIITAIVVVALLTSYRVSGLLP
ncbi:MAG TPA: DUF3429 family protein [Marinagarivorans sp.]